MKLSIVLVEPEIPQNTGNVVRTCAVTGAKLHLVYPLGFTIDNKKMLRSGLDYWDKMDIEYHNSFEDFLEKYKPEETNMFLTSSKGEKCYSDVDYTQFKDEEVFLLFGKETKGLPEDFIQKYMDKTIRIPMVESQRCLNLSNSVAVIAYEVLRQNSFEGLNTISPYFTEGHR